MPRLAARVWPTYLQHRPPAGLAAAVVDPLSAGDDAEHPGLEGWCPVASWVPVPVDLPSAVAAVADVAAVMTVVTHCCNSLCI
jgi:hypothetical protein